MLICEKIIKKIFKKNLNYVNFMLNYVKKNVFHRTDGQTDVQLKTIVRNLTKKRGKKILFINFFLICI